MLTLVDNLVTLEGRQQHRLPASMTAGELVEQYRRDAWGSLPVIVTIGGVPAEPGDTVPAGADVVMAPRIAGTIVVAGIAYDVMLSLFAAATGALGLYALGRAYARLVGDQGPAQERGDESSPTYSWLGQQTSYRTGQPKPLVLGAHEVPGQVVSSDIVPLDGEPRKEVLQLILVLSDSQCYAVGGVFLDRDHLGRLKGSGRGYPLLAGVRVNGNLLSAPGAQAFVRLGTQYQSPMPDFQLASSALTVSAALNERDESGTHPIANPSVESVRVKIAFPAGLFQQQASGQLLAERVDIRIEFRSVGGAAGWDGRTELVVNRMERDRFVVYRTLKLRDKGPWEVRVTRLSASRDPKNGYSQSSAVWESLIANVPGEFAYPRQTLLGLRLVASEQMQGRNVQVRVPVQGSLVWTYDAAEGVVGGRWGIHAPWQFEVGRNPAWCATWILMHEKALGELYGPDRIDWPAWRDFADYCDQAVFVNGTEEALHTFDGVFDSGEPAIEALARICRCGRGRPVMIGDKVSVRYSYRDSHGRGSNGVPTRQMQFLVSTANVDPDSVQIVKHDVTRRPTILQCQFLNRESGYEQDLLPVPDPEAVHDPYLLRRNPVVRETVPMYGITRPSAIFREATFQHAANRLGDMTLRFTVGVDALPMQVGDLFGFEFESIRPFRDASNRGLRARNSGDGLSVLAFDDAVTIEAGARVAVQAKGEVISEFAVLSAPGDYAAGEPIAIDGAVDIHAGAVCVVGTTEKVVLKFECVQTKLLPDMRREVSALRYDPAMHDYPDQASAWSPGNEMAGDNFAATPASVSVADVSAQSLGFGRARIGWVKPDGYSGQEVQVYVDRDDVPSLLGATDGLHWDLDGLAPHETHTVRVALQDRSGKFQQPEIAALVEFRGDEFPPVDHYVAQGLAGVSEPDGVRLRWDAIDRSDLVGYEVRRGPHWLGATVVGVVTEPHAFDDDAPFGSDVTYLVRGRYADGLYSPEPASVTVARAAAWTAASGEDLDLSQEGTAVGCGFVDGALRLDADALLGTYEMAPISAEKVLQLVWSVSANVRWAEPGTGIDDILVGLDSGEARWRMLDGREPTLALPGVDFGYRLDDAHMVDTRPHGMSLGEVGEHVRIDVDVAFDSGAGFGPWEPYELSSRSAQKMKVRLTLMRRSDSYEIAITSLRASGVTS